MASEAGGRALSIPYDQELSEYKKPRARREAIKVCVRVRPVL
jgi:hypothetical protein